MHRGAVAHTLRLGLLVAGVLAVYACGGAKPLSEEYGSLSPSRYVADEFQPSLSFEVGKGWEVDPLRQRVYFEILRNYQRSSSFVAISFNNPASKVSDPRNPNKLVAAPEHWVSWFRNHPYLQTSEPVPASVGGVEGERFDTKVSSLPEDYYSEDCLGYGVPLWPLLEGHHWCADEGDTSRTIVLEVEDETVIVDVYSRSETFEKHLPKAQEVLKTVKWEGAS
jgi:hypothetical protein